MASGTPIPDEKVAEVRRLVESGMTLRLAAEMVGVAKWSYKYKGFSTRRVIGKPIEFKSKKYYKTDRGYWRCKDGKLGKTYLHRDMWESEHGSIPKGMHVHHKDHNKDNNTMENFELLSMWMHGSYHGKQSNDERRQREEGHEHTD